MTLQKKAQKVIMGSCALLALIMIVDYSFWGKVIAEDAVAIKLSKERYFNAAQNFHYSFKLRTENHIFPVTENFASLTGEGQELHIEVSPFFYEVNWYENPEIGIKEVYSLRLFSGLTGPLIMLFVLALGFKWEEKISTLVFVIEAVAIANLIFLLN